MKMIRLTKISCLLLTLAMPLRGQEPASGKTEALQVDLPTVLQLARAQNTQVALARERVQQAEAELRLKRYLWIPTLNAGASWYHSEGNLQDSSGNIRQVQRTSGFFGAGSGAVAAGPLMMPGISLSANLAEAIFAPLAARQNRVAMEAAAAAVDQQVALEAAEIYLELVRAHASSGILKEASENAAELARITRDFAATGEGLSADAERARVEELVLQGKVEGAQADVELAAANLARVLHLEPGVQLVPLHAQPVQLSLYESSESMEELIAKALEQRPELKQSQALVRRAEQDLKQARYAPVVPNLAVGLSGGSLAGGPGTSLSSAGSRTEAQAMLYWSLDGLGLGARERARAGRSLLNQAEHSRNGVMDTIIAEVRAAHAQVGSRRRQVQIAEQAVQAAEASYRLNRSRIFEKQGLPIEVLQAIQSLAMARQFHNDAVTEVNQAQLRLMTALGMEETPAP